MGNKGAMRDGAEEERRELLGELADLLDRLASLGDEGDTTDGVIEFSAPPGLVPPMTWTTDVELCFTSATGSLAGEAREAATALIGRPLSDLLGTTDPGHPIVRHHRQALAGNTAFYRINWGQRLWFNHVAPMCTDSGVVGTVGFAFEVGAAGEGWGARASARRYRAVVSSAPVGVVVLSLDGQVLECNPALARILGYSQKEIRTRGVAGLSHPEDLMIDVHLFAELIEGKRDRYRIEKRYFRRDGSMVWCNLTVSLVRGDQGAPKLVVAVVEDVTERKQAAEALRESEARFRSLYESGMLGIVFFDANGDINDANDAFLRMVGYLREDLEGGRLPWKALTPAEFAPLDEQAQTALAARGTFTPFEKEYLRRDGTRIQVLVGGASFAGQKDKGALFVLDVSEKHRLEAQFQNAKRLEVLGRLAGGVAHDFNNILTSVLANVDLARVSLGPDHPARNELNEIETAGRRAAELSRQLLAFSCKQVLQPRVFDIDELVRRSETLLRRVIREDIRLVTHLKTNGAHVKADPGQLERALLNLVVNARDAMSDPGTIVIGTRHLDSIDPASIRGGTSLRGPCVAVSVHDSGSGMDADTMAQVFEPFFTTKGPGQGTGLGLSIVYGVVQQSGGCIRVESRVGAGTTFEVLLPESSAPLTGVVEPTAPTLHRGTETILIAEDDPMVLAATSRILTSQGYNVIATNGPAAALPASAGHRGPIHLLVSDVVMPGMSGTDLADRILRLHPEAKVLYVSGHAGNALGFEASPDRAVSVLSKPFSPGELAVKVREILG